MSIDQILRHELASRRRDGLFLVGFTIGVAIIIAAIITVV